MVSVLYICTAMPCAATTAMQSEMYHCDNSLASRGVALSTAFSILTLPLMLLPISQQVKMPRWVGYALYPLHLVVLIALEAALAQPIHTENLINAWNAFVSLF